MLSRRCCLSRVQSALSLVTVKNPQLSGTRVTSTVKNRQVSDTRVTSSLQLSQKTIKAQNSVQIHTKYGEPQTTQSPHECQTGRLQGNENDSKAVTCTFSVYGTQLPEASALSHRILKSRHALPSPIHNSWIGNLGTSKTYHVKDVAQGSRVRHISLKSVKDMVLHWLSKDKKLEKIVQEVQDQLPVNVMSRRPTPLSSLILGCKSSQHLLDLMSPYLEKDEMMVGDYLRGLEHLQTLVFTEIVNRFPSIANNVTPVLCLYLKQDNDFQAAVEPIQNNPVFHTLCHRLEGYIDTFNNGEFIACFTSLIWLGVSQESSLIRKCYEKLDNLGNENFTLNEIGRLLTMTDSCNRPDIMQNIHIIPKLKKFFKEKQRIENDKKTLLHLVFLLTKNKVLGLEPDILRHAYVEIYRICKETDHLQDTFLATKLMRLLHWNFSSETVGDNVMFPEEMFEGTEVGIIQQLSDMALEALEANASRLTPLDMQQFAWMLNTSLCQTNIYELVQQRATELIMSKKLKVPEIIYAASILKKPSENVRKAVQEELQLNHNHISFSCLVSLLNLLGYSTIERYDLETLVSQKILQHLQIVFQNKSSVFLVLRFVTRRNWQYDERFDGPLQQQLCLTLEKIYDNTVWTSYSKVQVTIYLLQIPRSHMLPTSIQAITKLEPVLRSIKLTEGQLIQTLTILKHVHLDSNTELAKLKQNKNNDSYRTAILTVLIHLTKVTFEQFLTFDSTDISKFSTMMFKLFSMKTHDPLCLELSMERMYQLTENLKNWKDFYSVSSLLFAIKYYHKGLLNNIDAYVLLNKDKINPKVWPQYLLLLNRVGHPLDVDGDVGTAMTAFMEETFDSLSMMNKLVNLTLCNRVGLQLQENMKKVFNVEFLEEIDKNIKAKPDHWDSKKIQSYMLFLNRDACVDYPELNIPWFHNKREKWSKDAPENLTAAITKVAGGNKFVGHQVKGEYGFVLWRVILLDNDNKPVEFCEDDFRYAKELGLNRICFCYYGQHLDYKAMTINGHLNSKEIHNIRQMEKCGYSCIVIYDTEWFSIGLSSMSDKVDFLRSKIEKKQKQCLIPSKMAYVTNIEDGPTQKFKMDIDYPGLTLKSS